MNNLIGQIGSIPAIIAVLLVCWRFYKGEIFSNIGRSIIVGLLLLSGFIWSVASCLN
jgi:hypothetical protein